MSGWTSALAVHNKLLRRGRGDLVARLAGPAWLGLPGWACLAGAATAPSNLDLAPGEQPVLWEQPCWEMPGGVLLQPGCQMNE